jgi:two-component system, LuxR family, sensor kinase FixL
LRLEPRRRGAPRWLSGQFETVAHDGIESRMLVVRDITRRVELEQEAAHREAELQRLSRQNAMGDMAMIIAHELGQPLAATSNFLRGVVARMDTRGIDEPDLRYGIDNAAKQLVRAAQIVASVKRYVQRTESTASEVDLTDVVRESLYFAGLTAAEHGVKLEQNLDSDPLRITAEQVLLGQVVLNLCGNAIEEAAVLPADRRLVHVVTYRDGVDACCAVCDQGRGLNFEGDRWSDRGFSDKPDGAGIGLMLCERILDRHGGELEIAPHYPDGLESPARGTQVIMRLPLVTGSMEPTPQ